MLLRALQCLKSPWQVGPVTRHERAGFQSVGEFGGPHQFMVDHIFVRAIGKNDRSRIILGQYLQSSTIVSGTLREERIDYGERRDEPLIFIHLP